MWREQERVTSTGILTFDAFTSETKFVEFYQFAFMLYNQRQDIRQQHTVKRAHTVKQVWYFLIVSVASKFCMYTMEICVERE